MKEPKIRFERFGGEWKTVPFFDTFEALKNNSLSRAELSDSGNVMNIHYGDVLIKYGECVDASKDVDTFVSDNEVAKKLHQTCAIKNGDIIFADAAEDNTVGKCTEVILYDEKVVSGLHTIPVRPKMEFASKYLGFYLNSDSYHNQLLPHIQGTKISSISKKALKQTKVSYPIKAEQQAVGTYFQHLDTLIQFTTKKIESLKQVKAASLQSMFPQEGETKPRVRFKGFDGNWEKVHLGEICEEIKRKAEPGSNAPVMMISASQGFINQSEKYSSDNAGSSLSNYTLLKKGELSYNHGYSKIRNYGSCFSLEIEEARVPFVYHSFKLKQDCSLFFAVYLNSGLFDKKLRKIVSSTARMDGLLNISYESYVSLEVMKPSIIEQQKIADYFTAIDQQITLQAQRLEKLKQIKSACLDNMFV